MISYRDYLKPEVIAKLANIELKARSVVDGFLIGLHKSPYHGFSVEFAEYRQYNPGDSLKHIDWRAYARTDRFYIKEFEEETNLSAYLLLDKSASMTFSTTSVSKLEYATVLAASIAYLLVKQKDAAGLLTFDTKIESLLRPSSTRMGLLNLLKELSNIKPGEKTDFKIIFGDLAKRLKKRGLVIVFSDLLADPEEVIESIKLFRHRKNEVIVFQILDPKEIDFNFKKEALFQDLETSQVLPVQPWALKYEYNNLFKDYLEKLKKSLSASMIDHVLLSTETPFDIALMKFLQKRSKLS